MLTLEEIVNHLSTTYMPISEELRENPQYRGRKYRQG
jgi:hypothetical protein